VANDCFNLTVEVNSSRGRLQFALNLDLKRFSHKCIYGPLAAGHLYEPEVAQFLIRALRPGDTFVDIGAHVGFFSLLSASLVGSEGHVFCFEPEPLNFAELVEHARQNSFPNIHAFNLPVCAQTGDVTFYWNADNDGGHALWDVGRHWFNERSRAQPQTAQLHAIALDGFDAVRFHPARVIKIDTEGAEEEVIRGAKMWLTEQRVPFVICEVNPAGLAQMNSSQMSLRGSLGRLGYATFMLDGRDRPPQPVHPDRPVASTEEVFNLLFSTVDAVRSLYPADGPVL
jgi:FkbM family methyltransferase